MKTELKFANPPTVAGKQMLCTVRRGETRPASEFDILTQDGRKVGRGQIEYTITLPFRAVSENDLKNEHDPACRTRAGLLDALQRYYPSFIPSESVTVINFTVLEARE